MSVRCGNKVHDKDIAAVHYHGSVADVRVCYAAPEGVLSIEEADEMGYRDAAARAEVEAEMGYVRHAENAGFWAARADEEHEMGMGIDPFNPLGPAFGLMV